MKDTARPIIGFIGQGYIGKSYADDFEVRGFTVIRYSMEESYIHNKDRIQEADIVFVAVPTPTRAGVFDDSILRSVLALVGEGKTVVIKSTLVPGTTEAIQEAFPHLFALHSPEFLTKKTAAEDASYPRRNIVGIPVATPEYRKRAEQVLAVLPSAPFTQICSAREAEIIKYANNTFFYVKVVYMNVLYDLASAHGGSWDTIREAMANEPWIGEMHLDPVHKSGRGAGGCCFIKDFAAFSSHYSAMVPDQVGAAMLRAIEQKNTELLKSTGKDLDELGRVYGLTETN